MPCLEAGFLSASAQTWRGTLGFVLGFINGEALDRWKVWEGEARDPRSRRRPRSSAPRKLLRLR